MSRIGLSSHAQNGSLICDHSIMIILEVKVYYFQWSSFSYSLHWEKVYTWNWTQCSNSKQTSSISMNASSFPSSWPKLGRFLFRNSSRWRHKRQKFKISTPTAWKSMGIFRFCDTSQERLPQTFCSSVAIFWNFKTRLGPVWTNSRMGVTNPLLFLYPPSILSTWLCRKCILSFGGDCSLRVILFEKGWGGCLIPENGCDITAGWSEKLM